MCSKAGDAGAACIAEPVATYGVSCSVYQLVSLGECQIELVVLLKLTLKRAPLHAVAIPEEVLG